MTIMCRKPPRALSHGTHAEPIVQTGDLSFGSTSSYLPAAGESKWWHPIAALGAVAVVGLVLVYGVKSGWT